MSKQKIEPVYDFGFSSIHEADIGTQSGHADAVVELERQLKEEVDAYERRIAQLCGLVEPLLIRLRDTANDVYIHWPNRGPVMQDMLDRIEALKKKGK